MISEELHILANKLAESYKQSLQAKGKNASRNLANSLEVRESTFVSSNGLGYKAEILGLSYWYNVDKGRGPTQNSSGEGRLYDAILEWIRVKPVTPYPDANGKVPTENQLAYLITRKIHRVGYKGSDAFTEATDSFMADSSNFDRLNDAIVNSVFNPEKIII